MSAKEKWRTLASAPTEKDLTALINEYYFSSDYEISGSDIDEKNRFGIVNAKTGKIMSTRAWKKRGRWYFGMKEEE